MFSLSLNSNVLTVNVFAFINFVFVKDIIPMRVDFTTRDFSLQLNLYTWSNGALTLKILRN